MSVDGVGVRDGLHSPRRCPEYRAKRHVGGTPEPEGVISDGAGERTIFVIQEHYARALHRDLRLERRGVFASWAVPKGLPSDPGANYLATRTEDHPLAYADFEGEIPAGQYGAGTVSIWDRGTVEVVAWTEGEVVFALDGMRTHGRYALIKTSGGDWLLHRASSTHWPMTSPTKRFPTSRSSNRTHCCAGHCRTPAEWLIDSMVATFVHTDFSDEHREQVLELIEARSAGEDARVIEPEEESADGARGTRCTRLHGTKGAVHITRRFSAVATRERRCKRNLPPTIVHAAAVA